MSFESKTDNRDEMMKDAGMSIMLAGVLNLLAFCLHKQ